MGFADKVVGPVAPSFEGVGIVHGTGGFTRIEDAVGLNSVVGQGLAAPEEPNGVSFGDGNLRGRKPEIGAVDADDNGLWLVVLRFKIALDTASEEQDGQQDQEGSHVQK
jgi:hypothetical protein